MPKWLRITTRVTRLLLVHGYPLIGEHCGVLRQKWCNMPHGAARHRIWCERNFSPVSSIANVSTTIHSRLQLDSYEIFNVYGRYYDTVICIIMVVLLNRYESYRRLTAGNWISSKFPGSVAHGETTDPIVNIGTAERTIGPRSTILYQFLLWLVSGNSQVYSLRRSVSLITRTWFYDIDWRNRKPINKNFIGNIELSICFVC